MSEQQQQQQQQQQQKQQQKTQKAMPPRVRTSSTSQSSPARRSGKKGRMSPLVMFGQRRHRGHHHRASESDDSSPVFTSPIARAISDGHMPSHGFYLGSAAHEPATLSPRGVRAVPAQIRVASNAPLSLPKPQKHHAMAPPPPRREFRRVHISGEKLVTEEQREVCTILHQALELREKYVFKEKEPSEEDVKDWTREPEYTPPADDASGKCEHHYRMVDGVFVVWHGDREWTTNALRSAPATTARKRRTLSETYVAPSGDEDDDQPSSALSPSSASNKKKKHGHHGDESKSNDMFTGVIKAISVDEFWGDLAFLMQVCYDPDTRSFAYSRLKLLEKRFELHQLLNEHVEVAEQKAVPHRDFYNVRKVDNHIHHSACMNQKHLLRFIKHKYRTASDDVVALSKDGSKSITLRELFDDLQLTSYELSVDHLDVRADNTFQRFDRFNLKYNPLGESRLREVFLKYRNQIDGRYLAELTREVMDDLVSNKYQFTEFRLSIYGRSQDEWSKLARWVVNNDLFCKNVRWMIQIPRLYKVYRQRKELENFEQMIRNIFEPLFKVTIDPSSDPPLHRFLQSVVGFDSVDDESLREAPFRERWPLAADWTSRDNPPYSMWAYYMYANLFTLNKLREKKGFSVFAYRPHAGEAGDVEHLAAVFLVARSINHGIVLNSNPSMQYLYYLSQIGLSMSPLSNNLLFVEYEKNPFPKFFKRGLNVTLSTDDPLMIHVTKEPLVEEYSVAAQVWKLSAIDMCEIARNSVLQSGFESGFKAHWIGPNYWKTNTVEANDIRMTNLPNSRFEFRLELLDEEKHFISTNMISIPEGSDEDEFDDDDEEEEEEEDSNGNDSDSH